jgi:hypothetical protein
VIAFFVLQGNMSSFYKILIVEIGFFQTYADCLKMNCLLEIDQVCVLVKDAYGIQSTQIPESTTKEEKNILDKLGGKMELI